MLAPILAFTADEAWEFVPGKPTGSVHGSEWDFAKSNRTTEEIVTWSNLFAVRELILPQLEEARKKKLIGKALEAKITNASVAMVGHKNLIQGVRNSAEDLRELLNVSQLSIDAHMEENLSVTVSPVELISRADGQKCERCWHWETDIGQNAEHPTICGRCVEAVMLLKA
jgi:isoleucyl-tRNA synthetase